MVGLDGAARAVRIMDRGIVDGLAVLVVEQVIGAVVDNFGRADDELAGEGMQVPDADGAVPRACNDFLPVKIRSEHRRSSGVREDKTYSSNCKQ